MDPYPDVDPKVPTLTGETVKDFQRYEKVVKATRLSVDEDDQKRLGPRLYRNLLGARNSVSLLVEQLDVSTLAAANGPQVLLKYLRDNRLGTLSLRELPRAYEVFYEQTQFRRVGEESMTAFCTSMEIAKKDLECVDDQTKISQNELGYWTLRKSGLDREERRMVLAQAGETFDFAKISATLKNLYPQGTTARKHDGFHRPSGKGRSHWTHLAEDQDLEEHMEHDEAMWIQDDDGYWYGWSD